MQVTNQLAGYLLAGSQLDQKFITGAKTASALDRTESYGNHSGPEAENWKQIATGPIWKVKTGAC